MNITELEQQLREAREKSLHPQTEVAISHDGWYFLTADTVAHPLDGQDGCELWFTLSFATNPGVHDNVSDNYIPADARFTPTHYPVPVQDPALYEEYCEDVDYRANVPAAFHSYTNWLRERYEGLAGALRDDPPRDREELATDYRALAALLSELERIDPS